MEIEKKLTLDLLDVNAPALSSTNDLPKVETKPDASPAAPAKPEVKAEAEKAAESAPAEQPDVDPPASDEPKKAKGVQKRIDELTRQAREAERLAEAERENNRRLLALLENKDKPKVEPKEDNEPVRPSRSDFTDKPDEYDAAMDEYISAKSSFQAKREVKAMLDEQKKLAEQKAIEDGHKTVRDAYAGRVQKASEKYPDYQEVAESPDVVVSVPMAHAILHSEHGPDIAYHLGKNPAEAERIAKLNPPLQLVELGLIVAKLTTPEVKSEVKEPAKPPVSNAPKPIKPLGAGSEKSQKSPEEESMDEYAARRKKELNERRPGTRH